MSEDAMVSLKMLKTRRNQIYEPWKTQYVSPLSSRPTTSVTHYNNSNVNKSFSLNFQTKTKYGSYCDICNVRLNSYLQSKSHYEGKPHAKMLKRKDAEKVKLSEIESKSDTLPESSTTEEPPEKKVRTMPVSNLYCSACNLTFTSEAHAKDHYLGRNHARILHGLAPYMQGYFNTTTNKWQRTPPDPRVSAQLLSSEPPTDMDGKPARQEKPKIRGKFHCEACNVSLTCEQQLHSHLAGSKHAKIVKREEAAQITKQGLDELLKSIPDQEGRDALVAAIEQTSEGPLSCRICLVVLTDVAQLTNHLKGKKHISRAKRHLEMKTKHKLAFASKPNFTDLNAKTDGNKGEVN